jgi:hypothetical protein
MRRLPLAAFLLPILALAFAVLPAPEAVASPAPGPTANSGPGLFLVAARGSHFELMASWGLSRDLGPEPVLGQAIPLGSTLSTGVDSAAILRLEPSGTLLFMGENTALSPKVIEEPSYPRTEIDVPKGRLRALIAPGRALRLRSPEAITLAGLELPGGGWTDLGILVGEGLDSAAVRTGLAVWTRLGSGAEYQVGLQLGPGHKANARDLSLQALPLGAGEWEASFGDLVRP